MKNDLISVDGRIVALGDSGFAPDALLSANFIYQKIHTLAYKPLHSRWIAEIAEMSCRALYDYSSCVTSELLDREIEALLRANGYPPTSTLVSLYLFPYDGRSMRMISCCKQLVYRGYALTTGLTCCIVPYEYPFPQHKTAVSLAAHTYADDYAVRKGFNGVITENASGVITGFGEHPVFALSGNNVLTPSLDNGAADSAERRLGVMVCEDMGLTVCEYPIRSADTMDFDEMFSVTPQGIASIRQVGNRLFPHSMARNILMAMKKYCME